jgi:predicted transcriptional regulator
MLNSEDSVRRNFNQTLQDAINECLSSLGNLPLEVFLHNLEDYFSIKKEDIPCNLAKFDSALNAVFGQGARCMERSITQTLCEKLNINVANQESEDFVVRVDELKRQLLLRSESK